MDPRPVMPHGVADQKAVSGAAMLRLKAKAVEESFAPDLCAAARCVEPAAIVDRTGRLSPGPVPLCDRHWQVRCVLDEEAVNLPPTRSVTNPVASPSREVAQVGAVIQLRLPFARR